MLNCVFNCLCLCSIIVLKICQYVDRKNIFRGQAIEVFYVFTIGQKGEHEGRQKGPFSRKAQPFSRCKKSPKKLVPLFFSTQCNIRLLFAS